jgi:hypothetical protein
MSPLDSQEEVRQVHEPRDAAQEEVGEGGQRRRGYNGTLQAGAARPVPGQVCMYRTQTVGGGGGVFGI